MNLGPLEATPLLLKQAQQHKCHPGGHKETWLQKPDLGQTQDFRDLWDSNWTEGIPSQQQPVSFCFFFFFYAQVL